jgi:S-(hydroxymethyl)mycothiol dehydrogenase
MGMGHEVRGVIARTKATPVELVTVQVPDPGPGEALVRVRACGVCHTDLHYREGAINDEFPFLLGHEASGTVEAVGPGVTNVGPGDFVVLALAGPLRAVPLVPAGAPLVLLRQPQRRPEDDPG